MEYGLIGKKLGHSFSKQIHESFAKYLYDLVELNENEFDDFMMKREFKGINVTIPYKEKVIPFLDQISSEAKLINAVNVVVNRDNKLIGFNSDYYGFKLMLDYFKIEVKNKKILILGTGGTSKTITQVVKDLGAKEIIYLSREKRLNNIYSYSDLDQISSNVEVLINTTPKEMYPNNNQEIISLDNFTSLEAVVDVIYNPLRTNLTLKARERKIKYCNGLYMLIAQAFSAMEIFLNQKFPIDIIDKLYFEMLKEKENIVLIGMPSSGKSTISKELAKKLDRKSIDIDEEIVKEIKMPIKEYFKNHTESEFREIESYVINKVSLLNNVVIATGGGSILKEKNVNALRQNGKLFFLDRSLNNLITTDSRPLSSNKNDLEKLYQKRYQLYLKYADLVVDGNQNIDDVVKTIINSKEETK